MEKKTKDDWKRNGMEWERPPVSPGSAPPSPPPGSDPKYLLLFHIWYLGVLQGYTVLHTVVLVHVHHLTGSRYLRLYLRSRFMEAVLVIFKFIFTFRGEGTVLKITLERFNIVVNFLVSSQLSGFNKSFITVSTGEPFISVVCTDMRVEKGHLRSPVLTTLLGTPEEVPIVYSLMSRQVGIVLCTEST